MVLFDLLKHNKKPSTCKRCRKKLTKGMFEQIGNDYFCFDCSRPQVGFPECFVLRTPALDDISPYKFTTFVCEQCRINDTEPLYFDLFFGQRLCYSCARKIKKNLCSSQSTVGKPSIFSYAVYDKEAEEKFWDQAVQAANEQRSTEKLPMPEILNIVDKISVLQKDDLTDPENSDTIDLYICSDKERKIWCFMLRNNYVSGWDGWPVYMGGFITPEQFLEYAHRFNYHFYDDLLISK